MYNVRLHEIKFYLNDKTRTSLWFKTSVSKDNPNFPHSVPNSFKMNTKTLPDSFMTNGNTMPYISKLEA